LNHRSYHHPRPHRWPRHLLLALLAVLAFVPRPAAAQDLVADISDHLIAITSDFTGTDLLVFGSIEGEGDIVVVVMGPRETMVVRHKARVAGIWINAESVEFDNVPAFYGVAATRSLEDIGPIEMRRLVEIGLDSLRMVSSEDLTDEEQAEFADALIELQQSEGLYPTEPERVDVVGGRLFRASIPFPAGVPVGNYTTLTYLIRDGDVVASQSSPLFVDKAGFGADIYVFAHEEASLYGILAVIGAVLAGLVGNFLFRRP
tara:strand:+ start:4967 stop:5746 length:780 start_codon:yes stop_codon:yes gene_type:complete